MRNVGLHSLALGLAVLLISCDVPPTGYPATDASGLDMIDPTSDAGADASPDAQTDAEARDEGLWPAELPDCIEQPAYSENAAFVKPTLEPLSQSYESLQATTLPANAYKYEVGVVENGVNHNAFTLSGESFTVGINWATSRTYDFDLRVLVMRNYVPIESTVTRASSGATSTGFWHVAPVDKAESMEVVVPGVSEPGVSEVEIFIWGNPADNLVGGFRGVAKLTHYNEVVSPHPTPCLIPARPVPFTEDELSYIVLEGTRLSVDHPDFAFPHHTNEFWPKLRIKRGESLDFLITADRPKKDLKMGAQILFLGEKPGWVEAHGVELPTKRTPPDQIVANFRYRKTITFDEAGTFRFLATQVSDPYIPTFKADNTLPPDSGVDYYFNGSNVVEVTVE